MLAFLPLQCWCSHLGGLCCGCSLHGCWFSRFALRALPLPTPRAARGVGTPRGSTQNTRTRSARSPVASTPRARPPRVSTTHGVYPDSWRWHSLRSHPPQGPGSILVFGNFPPTCERQPSFHSHVASVSLPLIRMSNGRSTKARTHGSRSAGFRTSGRLLALRIQGLPANGRKSSPGLDPETCGSQLCHLANSDRGARCSWCAPLAQDRCWVLMFVLPRAEVSTLALANDRFCRPPSEERRAGMRMRMLVHRACGC